MSSNTDISENYVMIGLDNGLSPGGHFKNTQELLNLKALKFYQLNQMHTFQCMSKIFCVELQRKPMKFHTKYLTHSLKDTILIQSWYLKSSYI